jgi:hypothetical protein
LLAKRMGGQWDPCWYYVLELFPVVISVHIWGIHLKSKQIIFNVDNQAI